MYLAIFEYIERVFNIVRPRKVTNSPLYGVRSFRWWPAVKTCQHTAAAATSHY